MEDNNKKNTGRKLLDVILSKNSNQKLNIDRRAGRNDRRSNTERRTDESSNYEGPASRFTIDRRHTLKDRRIKNQS